ncbi:MAG: tetratricopeptide repeat protein [Pseudomonadales bacterium]|nr:tetratricopeptide repeat protein [Pseudomonadales bacterium]
MRYRISLVCVLLRTLFLVTLVPSPAHAQTAQDPLGPVDHLALKLEADARWQTGDHAGAVPLYEKLVAAYPQGGDSMFRLARGLHEMGRTSDALPFAQRALEEGFADIEATALVLAQAMAQAGEREAAMAWLERALAAPLGDRPSLKRDDAFAELREDAQFRRIAGFAPADLKDRIAGWRYDLRFFVDEARRLHAAPDRRALSPAFAAAVAALSERVPELDDVAIAVELQRIIAEQLADGHSRIRPAPTARVPFPGMLPLEFYFFSDGLFVIGATQDHADLIGRRVLAIGDKPVDDILLDLAPFVSRDNDQGLLWLGPVYLRNPGFLRAMGYADTLDRVSLRLDAQDGPRSVELAAEPPQSLSFSLRPAPARIPPRWQARSDEPYWHESLPTVSAVYLQFNQVLDADHGPSIGEFARLVRNTIEKTSARNLIIDVRHNSGGDNFLHWPLTRLAAWHGLASDAHRTFVITGRATFSACQDFLNFLDRGTDAIFVGELSSSRPNFVGEDTSVELPWSGLRLSISSRWWQDSYPTDLRPYIPLSMPVALSSAEWLAGRDPVLDALTQYLSRN